MGADERLRATLAGTPLEERFATLAEPFLQRRGKDRALGALAGPALRGLARVLATNADAARYLSHRPVVLERLAAAGPAPLEGRAAAFVGEAPPEVPDLEAFLDELRLLRRDEECFAACFDLGGGADVAAVSGFLSRLAEEVLRRALAVARGPGASGATAILGFGRIAGREMTYHSDLDLVFLCEAQRGSTAESLRVAQRLIPYLTTMTGAGVAYAIDARLRPSGRQGMLVTVLEAFERYQTERAATWEHLALMRARAVAGNVEPAQSLLDRVRNAVAGRGAGVWPELAEMRARVEAERGLERGGQLAIKAGRGGLMDVEFLAGGALLETGRLPGPGVLPSIRAMLGAAAPGSVADALLAHYDFLRLLAARTRWLAGRGVEGVPSQAEALAPLAELLEPGLRPAPLLARLEAARGAVRAAWERVVEAGSVEALAGAALG